MMVISVAVPTIGSWKTRPKYGALWYSRNLEISLLLSKIIPSSAGMLPAMRLIKVLLPAPLPPITVMKSPSWSVRFK